MTHKTSNFFIVDHLIDARGIAELHGLAHRYTVSQYQRRYPDMPARSLSWDRVARGFG